ncbi:MAG TPA: hypothetical protein VGA40_02375 [Candidatus Acidoferrales bacterium]
MLKLRQMIPPLTARDTAGGAVRAWDFKGKRSLAIAFLHADCAACAAFLGDLRARAAELNEREAVALVVFSETAPRAAGESALPVYILTDVTGRSQRAFLGDDAFGPAGQQRTGVLVTDRFGEIHAQWTTAADGHALPAPGEVLSWLAQVQIACEECGAPHWPAD